MFATSWAMSLTNFSFVRCLRTHFLTFQFKTLLLTTKTSFAIHVDQDDFASDSFNKQGGPAKLWQFFGNEIINELTKYWRLNLAFL